MGQTLYSHAQGPKPAAADPRAASEAARKLIEKLGHPTFHIRESATKELEGLGARALNELLEGMSVPDAEIRSRCQRILARVLEQNFEERVAAFLKDPIESDDAHGLAGWSRFKELTGGGPEARQLFAEMQRAEPLLMETTFAEPRVVSAALEARCREAQEAIFQNVRINVPRTQSHGSSVAMLFVASHPDIARPEPQIGYLVHIISQSPFYQATAAGPKSAQLKRILGAWIAETGATNYSQQILHFSLNLELREGLKPAEAILKAAGGQPHTYQVALLLLGRFGSREQHLSIVESQLDNQVECMTSMINNEQLKTQVRDVALAVLVHLTGQNHKDYGFTRVQTNPQFLFNFGTLGFKESEQREPYIEKWREWSKKQAAEQKK